MVKIEEIPVGREAAERPWFKLGTPTTTQEDAIRQYARSEGYETLRGFWKMMQSVGWDYYDVIRHVSPRT